MSCKITAEPDYLRAELSDRETAEETRAFFRSVVSESKTQTRSCILIGIRSSRPIFQVDYYGLIELLMQSPPNEPSRKIALVGDTEELQMSNEHTALLAQQRGLNIRSFQTEALALLWLRERRHHHDRRYQEDRHDQVNRRQH